MSADFQKYLQSLCDAYQHWWSLYTITDVQGSKAAQRKSVPSLFDFGLMVQTVQPQQQDKGETPEKTERLPVQEGLRKYSENHVLLVGRPGSGKSTALARLLLEEAQKARSPQNPTPNPSPQAGRGTVNGGVGCIPVLVELRQYKTSVLDLIRDFLKRHKLRLEVAEIEDLLFDGQFLLLVDGVNELPNEEARRDLKTFRQNYPNTPMIFTTRDLGVGGDLGIEKKLEMQPLTEGQMQEFVRAYLPEQGEEMLRRLGDRLREFGQTPLLLWMLCELFRTTGNVPPNLGLVFRCFAQSYDGKIKDDVPASQESRRWWQELLQCLAFAMIQGETPTELRVTIERREAEAILEKFLVGKVDYPTSRAKEWLEDLLKYHLIQLETDNHIEFRQQLLQEYYAAECLLDQLSEISDNRLKRDYLNYLKWTQPLAMMLGLVEKESQALRVVKSALEVDLWLGAKLAGAVKREFQAQMVNLVTSLEINQQLKSQLLAITHCQSIVPILNESLQYENSSKGANVVDAFEPINHELTIPKLLQSLTDEDSEVSSQSAYMLKRIGTPELLPQLLDILLTSKVSNLLDVISEIQARCKYYNYFIAQSSPSEEENHGNSLINILTILNHTLKTISETPKYNFHQPVIESLTLNDTGTINQTSTTIQEAPKYDFHQPAIENLTLNDTGTINQTSTTMQEAPKHDFQQAVIENLTLNEMQTVNQTSQSISKGNKQDFTKANIENIDFKNLEQLDDVVTVPTLREASKNEDAEVRKYAAQALGQIGNESAISALIQALNDENSKVRVSAAQALGQIGNEFAISALIQVLNDENSEVRVSAAQALGQIRNESAISALIQVLNDENSEVRVSVAQALGQIRNESAIPALIQALNDEDSEVRVSAAEALSKVGNPVAISALIQALNDNDSEVRLSAAEGLAHIQIVQNSVAETTPDIQDLLEEIFQNYPSAAQSVTLAKIKQAIKQKPGLKSRLSSALRTGGDEALKAIFTHPIFTIPIDSIRGWIEENN